ncbi:glycosyltransferase [Lunatimonas lonarensis]|nr:glycosyltransferase [Lunatimonas lonarensis]
MKMEFLFITIDVWDSPPRARHQLAHALSRNFKVTFVSGNDFGSPSIKRTKVSQNLEVFIPSFPISRRFRYRTPILNESYQIWLLRKVKDLIGMRDDLYVICTDFGGYLTPRYFDRVLYFASDDFVNNIDAPEVVKAYTRYTQNKLVVNSFLALATAKTLVEGFRLLNANSFELPLGAPEFGSSSEILIHVRKRDGRIKVVLLGYIDKVKTPVPLLNKILELGNTEIYLIGPIKDDIVDRLIDRDRVISLGVQSGEVLYRTLNDMDVAIAPYYMEDTNTGRTPNKMWQYLAAGKPAVITNLPNVRHWEFPEHTVYKANSDEEFVQYIKDAYENDSDIHIQKRVELARENSWGKRADHLISLIQTRSKPLNLNKLL